ncbi:MAG: hypothetical protein KJ066_03000 [Acidobacteria bacterium]|nr:hypothetical protein [Acidobacteriota bacterium]
MKRARLAAAMTLAVGVGLGLGLVTEARLTSLDTQEAPAKPARKKFVPPVRGVAEIGYLKPVIKVEGKEVVTTMKVKNLSNGSIAGLRVDEFWYDKGGNMLPGDSFRSRQPINPGEVVDVILRTPRDPRMDRNSYQFSHANGQVKAKILAKIEES